MDPSEVEFLAEKCPVTIVPNFAHDRLYLISGDVGPFVPSLPVEVPLWLALSLRQQHKCRIVTPDWMSLASLNETKAEETESKVFTRMQCQHYMEVAHLILNTGMDDVPRADEIRTLVKDIWDLRMAKLRSSIDAFIKSSESHAKLDHLTVMEINTVRTFLALTLDNLHRLRRVTASGASSSTQE